MTTPFLQTAGWTLIHFLWQGCAIAMVAAVLLRLAERRSANARYLIACVALVAMAAAPVVTARLLWHPSSATAPASVEHAIVESPARRAGQPIRSASAVRSSESRRLQPAGAPVSSRLIPSLPRLDPDRAVQVIALIWLLGVSVLLARMAGGWWHVHSLHRVALATAASRWQPACRRIASRLGLTSVAHVVESIAVEVPTVVGWIRPVILLPVAAVAALTPAQVEAILAHELAHIRRHDYAVNLLQTLAETLLFYHPAVWWISKRIRTEREHCCDDIAVSVCGDAVSYAQALAELETWRVTSTSMAMAATGGSLLARVRRILREPLNDERRSPSWAVTLALTLVFTAGAGAVQQLPSWIALRGDARAASTQGDARLKARAPSAHPSGTVGVDPSRISPPSAVEGRARSGQASVGPCGAPETASRRDGDRWGSISLLAAADPAGATNSADAADTARTADAAGATDAAGTTDTTRAADAARAAVRGRVDGTAGASGATSTAGTTGPTARTGAARTAAAAGAAGSTITSVTAGATGTARAPGGRIVLDVEQQRAVADAVARRLESNGRQG